MRLKIKSGPGRNEYEELTLNGVSLDATSVELDLRVDESPKARFEVYVEELDIDVDVDQNAQSRHASKMADLQALERVLCMLDPKDISRLMDVARELIAGAMAKAVDLERKRAAAFDGPLDPVTAREASGASGAGDGGGPA